MTKNIRELTEKERRGIRKFVTDRCANYHEDFGCLPLDCNCVMLEKVYCGNAIMVVNTRIVTLQAMPPGTQIDKTTCFPFRKAGGFLCLLRLLPQALANSFCSG